MQDASTPKSAESGLNETAMNASSISASPYSYAPPVQQFFQNPFQANPLPSQPARSSGGSRSGACASRHMAAEQRRRARINERLEALRSLVPHSARANTAAFLTEVYNYISSLHQKLEKVGCAVIDLNPSEDAKSNAQACDSKSSPSKDRSDSQRHAYGAKSDESEVECDERSNKQENLVDNKSDQSPVIAPSLFDSSTSRPLSPTHDDALKESQIVLTQNQQVPSTPDSNSTPCDLSFHIKSSKNEDSEKQNLANNQFNGPALSPSISKSRLREIQPSPFQPLPIHTVPMQLNNAMNSASMHHGSMQPNGIQSPYTMFPIPTSMVAAAAAAIAESAAVAQTWGMAAAVAQAQVAAHVHAQAQAHAQALVHAQSQVRAFTNSQQYVSAPTSKKRRRNVSSDSCASRHRTSQTVVRPIALKPQP